MVAQPNNINPHTHTLKKALLQNGGREYTFGTLFYF